MILDSLENRARYYALNPRLEKAFDYLLSTDLGALPAGAAPARPRAAGPLRSLRAGGPDGGVPDRPASAIRRHPTAECRATRPAAGLPVGSGILWNGVWANFQINDYICPYDNATHAETLHHSGMQRRR